MATSVLRRLRPRETVLFVIDVQGRLAEKVSNSDAMLRRMQVLIGGCQALNIPTLWFEQVPDKLGDTNAGIKAALERANATRYVKHTFSAVGTQDAPAESVLAQLAPPLRSVVLCGIEAHICVMQTALDLLQRDYNVHVAADAVSSVRELDLQMGLQRMAREGATVSTVEMALFELLREADLTPGSAFRAITKSLM